MNIPRFEYPRPQFVRDDWMNLNGEWQFEIDHGQSGLERGYASNSSLKDRIIVPFCPESELSGVKYLDLMRSVWYKRNFTLPVSWNDKNKRIIFHIGACDYLTDLWINGKHVGSHIGGYVSFSFDITDFVASGENIVTIRATDDVFVINSLQANNKVADIILQVVHIQERLVFGKPFGMELVPSSYIKSIKCTPDLENECLIIEAACFEASGMQIKAEASFNGTFVSSEKGTVKGGFARIILPVENAMLWSVGQPNLYDLKLTLGDDVVTSYFGMRDISYQDNKILINGKPIFQRLILDQGFYPDGIYTAPCDDDLIKDIKLAMNLGFNGARLHQKVFEPRFLYHCDRMGYIVWGEHANWGLDLSLPEAWQGFIPEWLEIIERDYNHPSIVGWCPFNETSPTQNHHLLQTIYNITKAYDITRPAIDTSGWYHIKDYSDLYDDHDYNQNPVEFKAKYDALLTGDEITCFIPETPREICEKITFVSEYGGTAWPVMSNEGWGYGQKPKDEEEFYSRYKGLTEALLFNPHICAFCYTQLTDVEQEINGLYYYDRHPKFDAARIRAVNEQTAAIEKT